MAPIATLKYQPKIFIPLSQEKEKVELKLIPEENLSTWKEIRRRTLNVYLKQFSEADLERTELKIAHCLYCPIDHQPLYILKMMKGKAAYFQRLFQYPEDRHFEALQQASEQDFLQELEQKKIALDHDSFYSRESFIDEKAFADWKQNQNLSISALIQQMSMVPFFKGELKVKILKAKNLPGRLKAKHKSRNVHVVVEFGDQKKETTVIPNELNPSWESQLEANSFSFIFDHAPDLSKEIQFSVVDSNEETQSDQVLGILKLSLGRLTSQKPIVGWYDLAVSRQLQSKTPAELRVLLQYTYRRGPKPRPPPIENKVNRSNSFQQGSLITNNVNPVPKDDQDSISNTLISSISNFWQKSTATLLTDAAAHKEEKERQEKDRLQQEREQREREEKEREEKEREAKEREAKESQNKLTELEKEKKTTGEQEDDHGKKDNSIQSSKTQFENENEDQRSYRLLFTLLMREFLQTLPEKLSQPYFFSSETSWLLSEFSKRYNVSDNYINLVALEVSLLVVDKLASVLPLFELLQYSHFVNRNEEEAFAKLKQRLHDVIKNKIQHPCPNKHRQIEPQHQILFTVQSLALSSSDLPTSAAGSTTGMTGTGLISTIAAWGSSSNSDASIHSTNPGIQRKPSGANLPIPTTGITPVPPLSIMLSPGRSTPSLASASASSVLTNKQTSSPLASPSSSASDLPTLKSSSFLATSNTFSLSGSNSSHESPSLGNSSQLVVSQELYRELRLPDDIQQEIDNLSLTSKLDECELHLICQYLPKLVLVEGSVFEQILSYAKAAIRERIETHLEKVEASSLKELPDHLTSLADRVEDCLDDFLWVSRVDETTFKELVKFAYNFLKIEVEKFCETNALHGDLQKLYFKLFSLNTRISNMYSGQTYENGIHLLELPALFWPTAKEWLGPLITSHWGHVETLLKKERWIMLELPDESVIITPRSTTEEETNPIMYSVSAREFMKAFVELVHKFATLSMEGSWQILAEATKYIVQTYVTHLCDRIYREHEETLQSEGKDRTSGFYNILKLSWCVRVNNVDCILGQLRHQAELLETVLSRPNFSLWFSESIETLQESQEDLLNFILRQLFASDSLRLGFEHLMKTNANDEHLTLRKVLKKTLTSNEVSLTSFSPPPLQTSGSTQNLMPVAATRQMSEPDIKAHLAPLFDFLNQNIQFLVNNLYTGVFREDLLERLWWMAVSYIESVFFPVCVTFPDVSMAPHHQKPSHPFFASSPEKHISLALIAIERLKEYFEIKGYGLSKEFFQANKPFIEEYAHIFSWNVDKLGAEFEKCNSFDSTESLKACKLRLCIYSIMIRRGDYLCKRYISQIEPHLSKLTSFVMFQMKNPLQMYQCWMIVNNRSLLAGIMSASAHHLAFGVFPWSDGAIVIPMGTATEVRKHQKLGAFQDCLEINHGAKKYFFAGFANLDATCEELCRMILKARGTPRPRQESFLDPNDEADPPDTEEIALSDPRNQEEYHRILGWKKGTVRGFIKKQVSKPFKG